VNSCVPSKAAKLGYVPITGALKTAIRGQIKKIG
jgi:hypothetical protein